MTENVMVRIIGTQSAPGTEGEVTETLARATYKYREGIHSVFYDDVVDETEDHIQNTMNFSEDFLEVIKEGAINTCMRFVENQTHIAEIETGAGMLMLGVCTGKIALKETENEIILEVNYQLQTEDELLAICKVKAIITS